MVILRTLSQISILALLLVFAVSACQRAEEPAETEKVTEETQEVAPETAETPKEEMAETPKGEVKEELAEESPKGASIVGEEVEYSSDGTMLKGYLVYDKSIEGKRPGVIVVHEWWGLNDYARKRADMVAELGYTVLAVDMYGNAQKAANPDEAGKLSGMVMSNMEDAEARFRSGVELLRSQPTVDPERIAAMGYCFGGAVVLNMALRGVDLDGVASFHGILPADADVKPGAVKPEVIVFHGGSDEFVSAEQLEKFKEMMKAANANFKVIVYPDAKHSFTVAEADAKAEEFGIPLGYNAEADKDSWEKTKEFFKKIFSKEG